MTSTADSRSSAPAPGSVDPAPPLDPRHDPESTLWARPGPTPEQARADVAIAAALFGAGVLSLALGQAIGMFSDPAPLPLAVAMLALAVLPLAWRRVAPAPVMAIVAVAMIVAGELSVQETIILNIALFSAIYTVGAWERDRRRARWSRVAVIVIMFAWLVVSFFRAITDAPDMEGPGLGALSPFAAVLMQQLLVNVLYFAGAYWFGEHSYRAARQRALTVARTRELERQRDLLSRQAVTIERLRIARELHDSVAHHVSLIGIQAGAARVLLDSDVERARGQLADLESSARSAVSDLYSMLGTLRDEDAGPVVSAIRLTQITDLVAESQASGVVTELEEIGEPSAVSDVAQLALYRVCQEALTNVRKHGGTGTHAVVRLRWLEDAVELEVSDDGAGRSRGYAGGAQLGIAGMRERMAALGGSLEAGPRERRGFLVRARVPRDRTALDRGAQHRTSPERTSPGPGVPDTPQEESGRMAP